MATVQTDGTSPVTTSSTVNNGGIIKTNGDVSGAFAASNVSQTDTGVFGSTVVDNDDADKALSAGVFAKNTQRPVAKKVTSVVNTVSNGYLLSGASRPELVQSVKKSRVCTSGTCVDGVRSRLSSTAFREDKYNVYTGKFESGYPAVQADDFGSDAAANVTRQNPGSLVFNKQSGSSSVNYPSKTG
jgi:hypothetical protein